MMNKMAHPPDGQREGSYELRAGAEEFPLMIVISTIYPCNFGCPNCPYTDGNSEIRTFYRERGGDLFPVKLWNRIASEAGEYGAWLRCTGGGEPMLHPQMVEMIEFAKSEGARIWLNTNASMFGPLVAHRNKLDRLIRKGIDLIEFSMDAGDPQTYAQVRPPRGGPPSDPQRWWDRMVGNVRAALDLRKKHAVGTRIVVSIICQELLEGKLDDAIKFWLEDIEVDDVITRKFLSWDDNTTISLESSLDRELYAGLPTERKAPCVWPFERLNVDTLGRIALCGQDISFRTSSQFPNANEKSIKEIWHSEAFNSYRRMHLDRRGAECWPCRGCSAWLAGVRDWEHGWLKVLDTSADHLESIMKRDLGVEVDIYRPTKRVA